MALTEGKHVMLSYTHKSKTLVKMVYNMLTAENIPVWFDDRDMDDNIYDSMAEAVSNAAVVCCFMSQEYENSRNCKLELQHAQKLDKRIIPCMVRNRKVWKPSPSKWLDLIAGSIIAIDFSDPSEESMHVKVQELIKKIKNQSSTDLTQPITSSNKLLDIIREKYLRESLIKRIVNEKQRFPIEKSYINLAIVESKEQHEKEKKLKNKDENKSPDTDGEMNYDSKYNKAEILSTYEEIYATKRAIDIKDVIEKCKDSTRRVLVLGRAGIGKSIFCQYVTYQWAKGELWPQYELVILIRLRTLTPDNYPLGRKYTLADLVDKEYFQFDDMSEEDRQYFRQGCNKGKVLWILDGYDEFIDNDPKRLHLKNLLDHIRDTQHHILTSRPYSITVSYDVTMEITGFTDENILKYIEQFFEQIGNGQKDVSTKGVDLQNFLKSNATIWCIAHIPVNLELICSLWGNNDWSRNKTLTMTALYDNIIEWLCRGYLTRRDIKYKHMRKKGLYQECDNDLRFLEALAFKAMETNKIILPPSLLEETENETGYSLDTNPDLLNIGILKSYDDKPIGSNLPTETQHYFVHLSFQEHFAARHLLRTLKCSDNDEAVQFINIHKYNERFLLVFIFASGLLAQSEYVPCMDRFWSIIQEEPYDLIGLRHMKLIIHCMEELGNRTVFRQRTDFMKDICHHFDIYVKSNQSTIINSIHQSFQYAKSLVNAPRIQKKFVQYLKTDDANMKRKILNILSEINITEPQTELLTAILALLLDKDSYVKRRACQILGKMGGKVATNDVITGLINTFQDQDSWVTSAAWEALGKIHEKVGTNEVTVDLINAFRDEDFHVRYGACKALESMGEKAATYEVIDSLTRALKDENSHVRHGACEAFAKMGRNAVINKVTDGLINALQDEYYGVRYGACEALASMGEKAATYGIINGLTNALRDENSYVRYKACEALRNIGENARTNEVIAGLIAAFRDEDSYIRYRASEALRKICEKATTTEVIDYLKDALQKENSYGRSRVREALEKMNDKAATNEVIDILVDAIFEEKIDLENDHASHTLEYAMYSNQALSTLDSVTLSRLLIYMKNEDFELAKITADHFINAFLESKNLELAQLVAYGALLQGSAVTIIGKIVRIYDGKGMLEFLDIPFDLVNALAEAFRKLQKELDDLTEN